MGRYARWKDASSSIAALPRRRLEITVPPATLMAEIGLQASSTSESVGRETPTST